MGQKANGGRQASLDEKKSRSAGRRNEAGRDAILDAKDERPARGKTGGASGGGGSRRAPSRARSGSGSVRNARGRGS